MTATLGYAWWIVELVQVDPNSCSDTDFGLNFTVNGTINFTVNQTPYLFDDYCLNDTIVYEFACTNDVPELNLTDYAVLVGEDCTVALNNSNALCVNGKCELVP